MPVEPTPSPAASSLPFKLRFKQESKEAESRPSEEQSEETGASLENEVKPTIQSNGTSIRASKIGGIAPKRGPRVGPQYQANIPDLQE